MAKLQKLRPVAPQPGDQDRPPRCRAAGPQGPARNFLHDFFFKNAPAAPLSGGQVPAARHRGGRVYFCKFPNQKYIFVKNKNKKIKKPRLGAGSRLKINQHFYGPAQINLSFCRASSSLQGKGSKRNKVDLYRSFLSLFLVGFDLVPNKINKMRHVLILLPYPLYA